MVYLLIPGVQSALFLSMMASWKKMFRSSCSCSLSTSQTLTIASCMQTRRAQHIGNGGYLGLRSEGEDALLKTQRFATQTRVRHIYVHGTRLRELATPCVVTYHLARSEVPPKMGLWRCN